MELKEKISFLTRMKMAKLYASAFPKSEKKPLWLIRKAHRLGFGENYAIFEDGNFLGLAFCLKNNELTLLDYFAIEKHMRSKGYGARALQLIKEKCSSTPLILEIEDPNAPCDNREERVRRARFYEACGMRMMDFRVSLFGVDMRILTSGDVITFDQYFNLLFSVFGEHFSKNVYLLEG